MEIKAKTKFDIGKIVNIRDTEMHLVINNIYIEVCPGGQQILYKGIVTFKPPHSFKGDRVVDIGKELTINENMLEKLKPEKEVS